MPITKWANDNKAALEYWQQVCRTHKRTPFIKRAAPGGGGDSVPFEQAFSNLAHAYLKDRAPQLLDYELGFQLLEKNEDNDKAIGVFGFKVGPQLLYAPVFFLHGELQGHELLYLKESDTFVPLKENWCNYVLNRKPNVIGDHVMSQLNRLGVDRPSMDSFRLSPSRTHKYGSASESWVEEGLPGLMAALGHPTRPPLQLPGLIKSSAEMATRLLRLVDAYPPLAKPIVDCYGPELIKDAIKTAKTASTAAPIEVRRPVRTRTIITGSAFRQKTAEEEGLLQVWVNDGTPKSREGLTDKQAVRLLRDGYYIKDARDDEKTSKAYKELEDKTFMNPTETGIYEVLTKPGKFEKCLYIHSPVGPRGGRPDGVVICLEGDNAWTESHASKIFTNEKHSGKEYLSWFSDKPEAKSLDVGSTYVLLTQGGQGTGVFKVEKATPSGDKKCYKVEWITRYGSQRPDSLPPAPQRYYPYASDSSSDGLFLDYCKGRRFVHRLDAIYSPEGARAFKIAALPKDTIDNEDPPVLGEGKLKDQDDYERKHGTPENVSEGESSDPPALLLGNHVDAEIGIYKTSAELKVFNNGTEAIINGSRMSSRAGLLSLVRSYGLREKVAREILAEAAKKHGARYRIKFADAYGSPPGVLGSPPTSPPFPPPETGTDDVMGSGLPTTFSQEQDIPIESMRGLPTRPNYADPPDPQMAQQIQQAAQTGQKEVLDTSMLSNLLRSSQNETLIDKHLPALMKGLDSLGRLLFNMYWHHDKFEERYGARDLADLKDSMRNAFDGLGDVTLELKQDAIEPFPAEGVDVQFGDNR